MQISIIEHYADKSIQGFPIVGAQFSSEMLMARGQTELPNKDILRLHVRLL